MSLAKEAVQYGERLGAKEVEAYISLLDRKSVVLSDKIETLNVSHTGGLGVRVVIDHQSGFSATTSLTLGDVKRAVEKAQVIAKLSPPDKDWVALPKKTGKVDNVQTFDEKIAELEPSTLVQEAIQIIDTVADMGENLSVTRGEVSTELESTVIVNSYDCELVRKGTFASAYISVKAERGGEKGVSSESHQTRIWRELDCNLITKRAIDRALKVIHARPEARGRMPIVWHNKLFASVLGIMFGRTLSADEVQKGRSPWAGKVGKRIASKHVHLIDDGLLMTGVGTREFDDDGIPQRRVPLVEEGILKGFLYDNYTANKERRESTGNSNRDYASLPLPSVNNLILHPQMKKGELLADIKRGLYLVEAIGTWLSNPISGDLSATATNAFLIEDGELTKPIKGVIVSGNFFDILENKIELIADDVENLGSIYAPSVKITEMSVTGT